MSNLAILVPAYRDVDLRVLRIVHELARTTGAALSFTRGTPIDAARCVLATTALDAGAEAMLWVDADTLVDLQDVLAFLGRWQGFDGVVGAPVATRDGAQLNYAPEEVEWSEEPFDVKYLGGAVTLVPAHVYAQRHVTRHASVGHGSRSHGP